MKKLLALSSILALFSSPAFAVLGTANVRIVTPIAITAALSLEFGNLAAGATLGTSVISTAGARSVTGGVTAVTGGTAPRAGTFSVTGENNATYTITLPGTPATLTSGANTMTVNTFVSSPATTGTLSGAGAQTVIVGATLNVAANQATGNYTGTYDVTVAYN